MRILLSTTLVLTTALAVPAANAQPLRQPPEAGVVSPPGVRGPVTVEPVTRFTILSADVHFEDGRLFQIVDEAASLRAELRLLSDGAGLLFGTWEVSEPDFTGFRPLSRVRVPSAGRQMRRLVSPALPTSRPGLYELRFRPTSGDPTETIVYSVVPAPPLRPPHEGGLTPLAGIEIQPETTFRWSPVPGASVYRMEILVGAERLVAVDVSGPSARLRPPALARLRDHRGALAWRVTAYDAEGRILAVPERRATADGFVE